jgi:hypothetical protein
VAAALPISGLAAWQGLFDHARLTTGQTVLIYGAAGGVGSIAAQLAREVGAEVIGTGRADDRDVVSGFTPPSALTWAIKAAKRIGVSRPGDRDLVEVGQMAEMVGDAPACRRRRPRELRLTERVEDRAQRRRFLRKRRRLGRRDQLASLVSVTAASSIAGTWPAATCLPSFTRTSATTPSPGAAIRRLPHASRRP